MKRKPVRDAHQAEFLGLIRRPFSHPFRLRAGDVIRLDERLCRVIRVNECAAVVIMNRPPRQFTTRFDKIVRIQPKPRLLRVASDSEIEILNRSSQRRRP